jgi:hypothetical protein
MVEPIGRGAHRLGLETAGDGAAGLLARDEAGVGENVEVLHHRRQRHGEGLCQFADRNAFALAQLREQRAPRRVGEGGKGAVEQGGRIVNHVVKCNAKGAPVKRACLFAEY